jgi:hypothetical protein
MQHPLEECITLDGDEVGDLDDFAVAAAIAYAADGVTAASFDLTNHSVVGLGGLLARSGLARHPCELPAPMSESKLMSLPGHEMMAGSPWSRFGTSLGNEDASLWGMNFFSEVVKMAFTTEQRERGRWGGKEEDKRKGEVVLTCRPTC